MKKWKYVGDDERDFLFPQAFTVRPGDVVEADDNPSEAFFKQYRRPAAAESTDEKE
jgi:hypothetical protein